MKRAAQLAMFGVMFLVLLVGCGAGPELTAQIEPLYRFYFLGLSLVIVLLVLLLILYYRNYKIFMRKTKLIKNFYALRQTFIDSDSRLIYLKDENLRYLFVNKAFEDFYQKTSEDIIGRDDFALTDEKTARLMLKSDAEVVKSGKPVVEEVRWKGRYYKNNKFPVKLLNGRYGVGAYIEDITEAVISKRKEEKTLLRNSILVDVFTRSFETSRDQLHYVLRKALQLTDSKMGYICLCHDYSGGAILNSWSKINTQGGEGSGEQSSCRLEEVGLWGEAINQKEPIVVNDCRALSLKERRFPAGCVGISRFISIPVVIEGKVVAAVCLANKEDDYDDTDIHQVTVLMTGAWHALERRERAVELRRANQVLQKNQEKLQLLLDSTAEGIYGIDLEGRCTFCNSSCIKLLGYSSQEELIGKNMHLQIHHSYPDGTPMLLEDCRIFKALLSGKGLHVNEEVFWRADGTSFPVEYYSYPQLKDGKVIGAVVTFMDITERKKAEEKIKYISFHDDLTGLYNRAFFKEELKRLDNERNLPISIIMIDMNGLKIINDVFGHAAGDMLLKKMAEVFRKVCRDDDIIARIGGDEFVILLPKTMLENAKEIAARIKREFSKEHVHAIRGNISAGCSAKINADQSIHEVLKDAENGMYMEKTLNKKNFDRDLFQTIVENLHQKNPWEKEHAKRVSALCEKIGLVMQLPATEITKLKAAGSLHDIGKIILDEKLLRKEGPLTEQERREMEKHPVVGYRILNSFENTMNLAEAVLAHHEKCDGSGYPKGLKRKEIPKIARIIAVVEEFEGMMKRTGNDEQARQRVLEHIRSMAGSKFDPDVVAAFLEVMETSKKEELPIN